MRRFINPTILCLCLVALVAGAATETSIDYTQVAEDIDVMAKIIDKTLEAKFPDEYKASKAFFPFGEFRGCQGIYLKGYGAVFMTNISFPVAEQKPLEEKVAPDDLWQRTKYELRGVSGTGGGYFSYSSGGDYDSEKVKLLKEELLKLIGTYAPNIRQLGTQENIVIAMRGTATPGTAQVSVSRVMIGQSEARVTESSKPQKRVSKPESEPTGASSGIKMVQVPAVPEPFAVWVPDSAGTGRTTLIVRVSKESITAYKSGKLDLDGFTKQAEITQY